MKVTRDVIYDLLPAYFADEVSGDSRALIEEFLATDPELRRMAERFRARMHESVGLERSVGDIDREKAVFGRAKARLKLRQAAIAWSFGAVVAFGLALLTGVRGPLGLQNPGTIIGLVFAALAAGTWAVSYRVDAERWYRILVEGDAGTGSRQS